jgi:hypothetical protein
VSKSEEVREVVGHLFLSKPHSEGPPHMGFGQDWKTDLLDQKGVSTIISRQSEDWLTQLAEQLYDEDTVVFHVYTTRAVGRTEIDFFDCACPFNQRPAAIDH